MSQPLVTLQVSGARSRSARAPPNVVIGAVRPAVPNSFRLHRANRVDDETMRDLGLDLDLVEMGAVASKV